MKKYIFLSVLVCTYLLSSAQDKRALTHQDYDAWQSMRNIVISNNGSWVGYQIYPQDGDATAVWTSSKDSSNMHYIDRAYDFKFSNDSKYLLGKIKEQKDTIHSLKLAGVKTSDLPLDSLFIVSLKDGTMHKKDKLISYKKPEKEGTSYAALFDYETEETVDEEGKKVEKKENDFLLISSLDDDSISSLKMVETYGYSEDGSWLYAIQKPLSKDDKNKTLYILNVETGVWYQISSTMTSFKQLAFSKQSDKLAYIATKDDSKSDTIRYQLYSYDIPQYKNKLLANGTESTLLSDSRIAENTPLKFSEQGDDLFFGVRDDYKEYAYESDSTILKEDRVKLDIWSWQDVRLQSEQKVQLKNDLKKSYLAVYHYNSQKLAQLEDRTVDNIIIPNKITNKLFVGYDYKPYRINSSWNVLLDVDVYLVDGETGEKSLFKRKLKGYPKLSPESKYLSWYNYSDSTWMCFNVATKDTIILTNNEADHFTDMEHDQARLPSAYGSAGWLADDKAFIVYSQYDIWSIDPLNPQAAIRLTNGLGRKTKTSFRVQQMDYDRNYFDPKLDHTFYAFDNITKNSGYYKGSLKKAQTPKKISMGAYTYTLFAKAKNSDVTIYRKGNFEHYTNLYTSNTNFGKEVQLSNLNPQQKTVNWGTCKLIKYTSLDNDTLSAILYKPENFDPNKKYPVIFSIYEQHSNELNSYIAPKPSASTINIPYFVSNGYIVVVPDIKYTIGEPGQSAYNCVVGAAKTMMKESYVDSTNMAIQGQSWGGYEVAYIITQTDMFKAAGAGAPVANMTSAYGGIRWKSGQSRMFQYEQTQSRIGSTLWNNPDLYLKNSPLFYANHVKTPVLITHNDADGAVPWYQGIEFFMALKRNQTPAWLLVYNGETHNLTLRKNRKDLSIRLSQFFDHYLKDAPAPKWMTEGIPAIEKGRTLKYELE